MQYVILGAGAAGIMAAKTIRKTDAQGEITVISTDTQVHSRCMLHKFLYPDCLFWTGFYTTWLFTLLNTKVTFNDFCMSCFIRF